MIDSITVLDHGYISVVESWGSDERIIEAARMSTGKGFLGWGPKCIECGRSYGNPDAPADGVIERAGCLCGSKTAGPGDEKLLRYLWENKHATPFEMAGLVIEVQAPIFVFREWHRHRTQSFNEMSSRYMPLPDVNYVPTVERLMAGGGHLTKQAGTVAGAAQLNAGAAEDYRAALIKAYGDAEFLYRMALSMGVPKELARVHLPVGRYSRMRASANLRNWLAFLTLRLDVKAQYEIRVYADALRSLLAERFPRTVALFSEGVR
jgi:thymidylate synthase (FAD)